MAAAILCEPVTQAWAHGQDLGHGERHLAGIAGADAPAASRGSLNMRRRANGIRSGPSPATITGTPRHCASITSRNCSSEPSESTIKPRQARSAALISRSGTIPQHDIVTDAGRREGTGVFSQLLVPPCRKQQHIVIG